MMIPRVFQSRRIRYITGLVMFGFIVSSAVPTFAQGPQPPQVPHLSLDEAQGQDAQGYALDQGITLDEAKHRLHLQSLAGDLSATLRAKEQGTFAGLRIEHKPEFRVVVQLTRGNRETVRPYIEHGPLANLVEVHAAPVPLAALEARQETVVRMLNKLGVAFGGDIDIATGQVKIHVLDAARFNRALEVARIPLPTGVTVVTVDALPTPEADLYGGLAIDGPTQICTSGFGVVHNSTGTRGIVTAGHCDDTVTYGGVSLPYGGQLQSGAYDTQFNKGGGYNVRNLIFTGSSTRNIVAQKTRTQQALNEYVCKHGRRTGYTCGYIVSFSGLYQGSANWIVVRRAGVNMSEPGDSGAPWFSTGTAYGVHAAGAGDDAYYQSIDYALSPLGLSLLTQ